VFFLPLNIAMLVSLLFFYSYVYFTLNTGFEYVKYQFNSSSLLPFGQLTLSFGFFVLLFFLLGMYLRNQYFIFCLWFLSILTILSSVLLFTYPNFWELFCENKPEDIQTLVDQLAANSAETCSRVSDYFL